jgi:predicted Holliday junction resolvase-like endonuclease
LVQEKSGILLLILLLILVIFTTQVRRLRQLVEENEALKTRLAQKEAQERQLVVSREGAAAEREDKEEEGRALEVRGEAEEAAFRSLNLCSTN